MVKTLKAAVKSGQRLKKGKVGKTTQYITRAKALRKLQIPLKDFRRLCILKGIFPREAPHGKDKGKIYYHMKDINYMQHEPILDKFRQLKIFMRKRARLLGRHEQHLAESLQAPVLKLDHLVRERYPTSIDALKDLDDPLNMLFLFNTLRSKLYKSFTDEDVQLVARLTGEWLKLVIKTSALRKVFVSIKGYYFQAQMHNIPITWLVPHQAMQYVPKNVDFDIMTTFLHFYLTMLRCVNFKIAKDNDEAYPVSVPSEEEVAKKFIKDATNGVLFTDDDKKKHSSGDDDDDEMNSVQKAKEDDKKTLDEFTKLDPSQNLQDIEKEATSGVFKNCVFFVGREVSFEPVAFIIRCGGGIAIHETSFVTVLNDSMKPGDCQKWLDHEVFTHQVVDRPALPKTLSTRSYVQPQWVFDSFNMRTQLPIEPYTIGAKLPPHLSPFVDNIKENYIPAQLNQLREWVGLAPLKEKVIARISDEEREKELAIHREEQQYLLDMQKEMEEAKRKKRKQPTPALPKSGKEENDAADDDDEIELDLGDDNDDVDGSDDEEGEIVVDDVSDDDFDEETYLNDDSSNGDDDDDDSMEDVAPKPKPTKKPSTFNPRDNDKQLAKIMMKKKDKRLHNRMMFGITEKAKKAQVLKEKRVAAEKGIKNPKLSQLGPRSKRQR